MKKTADSGAIEEAQDGLCADDLVPVLGGRERTELARQLGRVSAFITFGAAVVFVPTLLVFVWGAIVGVFGSW